MSSSGSTQHLPAKRVGTEADSDGATVAGSCFVHDGQHLHHHVRTSRCIWVCNVTGPQVSLPVCLYVQVWLHSAAVPTQVSGLHEL